MLFKSIMKYEMGHQQNKKLICLQQPEFTSNLNSFQMNYATSKHETINILPVLGFDYLSQTYATA